MKVKMKSVLGKVLTEHGRTRPENNKDEQQPKECDRPRPWKNEKSDIPVPSRERCERQERSRYVEVAVRVSKAGSCGETSTGGHGWKLQTNDRVGYAALAKRNEVGIY